MKGLRTLKIFFESVPIAVTAYNHGQTKSDSYHSQRNACKLQHDSQHDALQRIADW